MPRSLWWYVRVVELDGLGVGRDSVLCEKVKVVKARYRRW